MNVCVFCGSSEGARPEYARAAAELGRAVARGGHRLVYGGARAGLMGVLADAALDAGGDVTGVLPQPLFGRELAHPGLAELVVVRSMHERKATMVDRSDAFVVLPGGIGTLDETFEVLSWAQLGIHSKPVGLLDVEGYFEALLAFLDHTVAEGFVGGSHRELLRVERDVETLLAGLEAWTPARVDTGMGLDDA